MFSSTEELRNMHKSKLQMIIWRVVAVFRLSDILKSQVPRLWPYSWWFEEVNKIVRKEYDYLASLILYMTLLTIPSLFTEQWPWRSSHVNKQHISQNQFSLNNVRKGADWLIFPNFRKQLLEGFDAAQCYYECDCLHSLGLGFWFSWPSEKKSYTNPCCILENISTSSRDNKLSCKTSFKYLTKDGRILFGLNQSNACSWPLAGLRV